MNHKFISFVGFLVNHELIDPAAINDDSDAGFENRLKAQKYCYLAQECFGLNLGYSFTLYRFGPYSPSLAEQVHYTLDMLEYLEPNPVPLKLDPDFDSGGFLATVSNKDVPWLELASTIIDVSAQFNDHDTIVSVVSKMKPRYTRAKIYSVLIDLFKAKLLPSPDQS